MLLILILIPTFLALASHDSDAEKYAVEESYRNDAFIRPDSLSVENQADNGGVRVKRAKKKTRKQGGKKPGGKKGKKRPSKGKGAKKRTTKGKVGKKRPKGKVGKTRPKGKGGKAMKGKRPRPKTKPRPKPNQNKQFSDKIKRIEGQLNNFVASSSMQTFKANIRAEVLEATRVVPDLIRFKAQMEQEMETNNLRLEEALASLAQV